MQKMIVKLFFLVPVLFTILSADNNVVSFYKEALKTLSYQNTYDLQEQSGKLSIEARKMHRYLNLNADVLYGATKAKLLERHFNNTDISLTDTIDIFGKNVNDIHLIQLQMKEDRLLMESRKEQLFLLLLEMITSYRINEEKLQISQNLYIQQSVLLKSLREANKIGAVSIIDVARFENIMALLKVSIEKEKQLVSTMKAQLNLYGNGKAIPYLKIHTLHADIKSFLLHSPQLNLNNNRALQSKAKADKIKQQWMPDAIVGATQQFNDDPTAYGDNFTVNFGLTMAFDGGRTHKIEKQKVDALRIQSQRKEIEIQRKAKYIALKNAYISSKETFYALQKTVTDTSKTIKDMRTAYLNHYIDINSYIQILEESLSTQNSKISAKYGMIKSAVTLNILSEGKIY